MVKKIRTPKYKISPSYIKTKKIPVELKFKRKDGSIVKIKATKIVRDRKVIFK